MAAVDENKILDPLGITLHERGAEGFLSVPKFGNFCNEDLRLAV